jgi:hypothetical protein
MTVYRDLGWVLPSEVFPLSMRSRGVSLSTASNWVNNCTISAFANSVHTDDSDVVVLIGLITPALVEISAPCALVLNSFRAKFDNFNSATFMIFAIACSAGYLWATYIVPETANVSLEEIDAVFKSPAASNDMLLKLQVSLLSADSTQ